MKTSITLLLLLTSLLGYSQVMKPLKAAPILKSQATTQAEMPTPPTLGFFSYYDKIYILDSVVMDQQYKESYAWDDSCNLIQESSSMWNESTNSWFLAKKDEFTYLPNGNLTMIAHYYGDSLGQEVGNDKHVGTYDSTGDTLLTEMYYSWGTNDWKSQANCIVRYTTHGAITTANTYSIIENLEVLTKQTLDEKTGDSTSTIIHLYPSSDNPDTMLYKYKLDYTYNSNMQTTHTVCSNWIEDTKSWQPYYQQKYTYNEVDLDESYTLDYWMDSLSQWKTDQYNTYVYDDNNNPQNFTNRVRDEDRDSLINLSKMVCAFDEYKNMTNRTDYIWNKTDNSWMATYKVFDINYDFDVNLYETLLSPKYAPLTQLKLDSASSENFIDGAWIKNSKSIFHYSNLQETALVESKALSFDIYPNPTSNVVHINLPQNTQEGTFTLWDISGKCLMTASVAEKQTINVQEIPSGYYLCKVQSGNQVFTNKLIIK